jgi:hypothetical protein
MLLTRSSDRRVLGHRRWLGILSVIAVLGSVALVAPAASSAKSSVSTSAAMDPACGFVAVSGSWTRVSGQSYVGVELSDNQSGLTMSSPPVPVSPGTTTETVDIGGSFSPLSHGKHVLKVTFTVYDADLNPMVSGKANANLPCALDTVVLPT